MDIIKRITFWGETHHPKLLIVLRILLGVILFAKGFSFGQNPHDLIIYLQEIKLEFLSILLRYYITYVQLTAGLFIAIGLLTRLAVLFVLPILLGAIIFVNASLPFFSIYSELFQSVAVLALLITFFIFGSGPISLDAFVRKETALK